MSTSLPKRKDLALLWMEPEFQFHECQETAQNELEELVQLKFVLELLHKFWNLNLHEGLFFITRHLTELFTPA